MNYTIPYTNDDLLALLKRHTGHKKEDKCDCNCPYTGNSVELLIRFVVAENNLNPVLADYACNCLYLTLLQDKQCIVGNRKAIAAALLYIAGLKNNDHHTQEFLAKLFFISPITLRSKYKWLITTNTLVSN